MKRLFAIVLVLAALTVTGILPTQSVDAAIQGICDYYSDPGLTTLVGRHGYDCCGNRVDWGPYTQYRHCYQEVCVWCPPPES